jgi:uncharacterized protein
MDKMKAAEYFRSLKQRYKYLNKIGKVVVVSNLFNVPEDMLEYAPYSIGMVEFEDKEIAYGQIIDAKEGDKVKGCLRRLKVDGKDGLIYYGVKFKKV